MDLPNDYGKLFKLLDIDMNQQNGLLITNQVHVLNILTIEDNEQGVFVSQ